MRDSQLPHCDGSILCSNNSNIMPVSHIQNVAASGADAILKETGEKVSNKWVGDWLTFNIFLWMKWHNQQSCTCPLTQKVVLPQKDITWQPVRGCICLCNKEWANCHTSRSLSDGKDTDISTVSQHSPKKKSADTCQVKQSLDLEKLICNLRWTNKAQNSSWPLVSTIWASLNQDIIQIHNNIKTHTSGKQQWVFSMCREYHRAVSSPNSKSFQW